MKFLPVYQMVRLCWYGRNENHLEDIRYDHIPSKMCLHLKWHWLFSPMHCQFSLFGVLLSDQLGQVRILSCSFLGLLCNWDSFFQRNNIPIHKNVPAKKRSIRCQKGHWCYLKVNYLQLVPDTNLIFLKISIHYRCVSMCRDHKLRLARLRTDFDEFCKNTSFVKQKYRRQPSTCFNGTIPQTRRRRRRRRRRKVKKRNGK